MTEKYKYVAPAPPSPLIDPSVFVLDFTERKFIHVGIDKEQQYWESRGTCCYAVEIYRCISTDFLRRIFALMDNILSFVLDSLRTRQKSFFFFVKRRRREINEYDLSRSERARHRIENTRRVSRITQPKRFEHDAVFGVEYIIRDRIVWKTEKNHSLGV